MTVEEYASIYDNKRHTPTLSQLREKEYIYKYNKEEYWIGEYEDHQCERRIAQFMNCATPGTEERKWLAAKVTALEVQEEEQLLTMYGGRKVVSTECIARECPDDLRHTIQPAIELSPTTAHEVVPMEYYGYSDDRSWKVKMEFKGSRLVKRRQRARVLSMAEEEAVTYLLTRHDKMKSKTLNRIMI